MKNIMLLRTFSLMMLLSFMSSSFAMTPEEKSRQDKREKQKMFLMLAGSGLFYGATVYLADRAGFSQVGDAFNLSRGELQAAFGLSSTLSGLAFFTDNKQKRKALLTAAMHAPLITVIGGLISHPQVNSVLGWAPFGLGQWFKENPAGVKAGITTLYGVAAWKMVEPTLESVENKYLWKADKV